MQAKLLTFLESRTFRRVGSTRETLGILHHLVRRRQREGLLPSPTEPPEGPVSS